MEPKTSRDYLSPLIHLMKLAGLWQNFAGPSALICTVFKMSGFFRFFLMVVIWTLPVGHMVFHNFNTILQTSSMFIPIGLVVVVDTAFVFIHYEEIEIVVDSFKSVLSRHHEEWQIQLIQAELQKLGQLLDFQKLSLVVFAIFYVFLPLVVDFFIDSTMPYKVPLPLDVFLSSGTDQQTRDLSYLLVELGSHAWFILIVSNYIGYEGMFCYFVDFIIIELKIITRKIENLQHVPLDKWELKPIINSHQEILRIVNKELDWIGLPMMIQNVASTFSMCLLMYHINKALRNNDYLLVAFCVVFLFISIMIISIFCSAGDLLQRESEKVAEALYGLPWYKQDIAVRKDLNMMLRQAVKLIQMQYKGQKLNLVALMKVVDQTFSFFMLLKSME